MDIHNFKFSSSHISKGKKIGKINIIIIFYLIPMSKVLSFQQVIKIKLNEFFKISFEILCVHLQTLNFILYFKGISF